jgi:hypothetical protein
MAKITSRQDALQTIFFGQLAIFYPQNLPLISEISSFSTATAVHTIYFLATSNRSGSLMAADFPCFGQMHCGYPSYSAGVASRRAD